jgi:alkylation response protein AidB-like acyl-CoA dehydrogenase
MSGTTQMALPERNTTMIDFEQTQIQRQLVQTAREFGKEVLQPAEIELDRVAEPDKVFGSDLFWNVMAQAFELGFHKMGLAEPLGGLGLDPNTTGMIWEELGRYGAGFAASLLPGAAVQQLIAFLAPDNRELVDRYVIPYAEDTTGRKISAWGSSEPDVGSDGSNYYDPNVRHHTSAVKKGDRYIINGTKSNFVSNGGIADVYLIFACVDPSRGLRGSGAFVVPGDSAGVMKARALDKIGLRTLNQAPVFFEDVEIPEHYMIFPPGEQYPMLHNAIITVGNLGVGYLAVGVMRAAYEEALSYSKERTQWGKPILEHQLVTKKLFDIFMAIESARAFLWKASWLCKNSFPGDLKMSLAAKIYATQQAVGQTAEMVQVLGGYGISKEYTLEKHARDAQLLPIMDGTNETLLIKAAALL